MRMTLSERKKELQERLLQKYGVTVTDNWTAVREAGQTTGGMSVSLSCRKAVVTYSQPVQFFRGCSVLEGWLKEGRTEGSYAGEPVFSHLTYMMDCSRNGVASLSFAKDLIGRLAALGYDRMMLYTEDTYEIEGQPFFGYLRGRYSREELRELDMYAESFGVELVPCIQTLAHLGSIFRWEPYQNIHDTEDILCCDLEETYDFIEEMVKSCAESFHSRMLNIGMDEAHMVGRGNYIARFGYEERIALMERHLKRVVEICRKYGFTCMMWSDMFFRILTGGNYYGEIQELPADFKKRIPEGLELLYWDYYSRDPGIYDRMMASHKKMTEHVGFAGGAWKWTGFAPLIQHSLVASEYGLDACRKYGIENVIVTGWGDDGNEASQTCVFPVLTQYAEYNYQGSYVQEEVERRFRQVFDAEFSDFLALDSLNFTPDNPAPGKGSSAPAKYFLYQDILLGIYDPYVVREHKGHYEQCCERLQAVAESASPYAYVFDTMASLAKVLACKTDLGVRIRAAYEQEKALRSEKPGEQRREGSELAFLAEECRSLSLLIQEFHDKQRKQWFLENKAFGEEVIDIRLGALKERALRSAERICAYLDGEISRIEELEEERLLLHTPYDGSQAANQWKTIVTANVISM